MKSTSKRKTGMYGFTEKVINRKDDFMETGREKKFMKKIRYSSVIFITNYDIF